MQQLPDIDRPRVCYSCLNRKPLIYFIYHKNGLTQWCVACLFEGMPRIYFSAEEG